MASIKLHHHSQIATLVTCFVRAERHQAFLDHIAHFLETETRSPERLSVMFLPTPRLQPSTRELEVLRLVAEGYSNPEIAEHLKVSRNTIKTHVRSLMNKFGVDRRVQLVAIAMTFDASSGSITSLNKAS